MIRATRSLAVQKIPATVSSKAVVRLMASKTELSYTEQQAAKGRHVSPHVTVYKFPIAALSSITNRVTGVVLSAGKHFSCFEFIQFIFNFPILLILRYYRSWCFSFSWC